MKGVIFNVVEEFIIEGWGEDVYDEIMEMCPVHSRGPFVAPGTYPDEHLVAIASAAAGKLGLPLADALRAVGTWGFPKLADQVSDLIDRSAGFVAFLKSVDSVIHVEVRKLMPEAVTPRFTVESLDDDVITLRYQSNRKMCALMEGLLQGAADYFDTPIEYSQRECMHDGAEACVYTVRVLQPALAQPTQP